MRRWIEISRVLFPSRSGLRPLKSPTDEDLRHFKELHKVNAFNCAILVASWVSLLADCPCTGSVPRSTGQEFYLKTFNNLLPTVSRFSQLADVLINSVHHTDHGTSISFIDEMRSTPVFKEYLHFYRTGNIQSFRYVYSFLSFGKKLYYADDSLEASALRDWLDVEARLATLSLPEEVSQLKTIVSFCLKHYEHIPFPVHGSGAVAQRGIRGVVKKNGVLEGSFPHRLRLMFRLNKTYANVSLTPSGAEVDVDIDATTVARLMFVPKTYKSRRSICMEPAQLQWAQQSVRMALERSMKMGFLGHFVNINDQAWNQAGSQFGSLSSLVDTIDLSAASDSVAWSLAKEVFPRKVLLYLAATRSTYTELPDGSKHKNIKFAPMGSAVCFPLQTVLFASIVILAAYRQRYGSGLVKDYLIPRLFDRKFNFGDSPFYQPFRVYGDDIICDTRITAEVVSLLTSFGFKVNTEKSFFADSAFRESCGAHHLDGKEVTPLYFRIGREHESVLSASKITALVAMCNRSREYKYFRLARYLQELCLRLDIIGTKQRDGLNPILFSDKEHSLAIKTDKPVNGHLACRKYTPGMTPRRDSRYYWQRDEVLSLSVVQKNEKVVGYDNYFYISWMRSRYGGGEVDDVSSSPLPYQSARTRVRRSWTPA